MAVSVRLDAYLALEQIMLDLDAAGEELAETIRDMMDPVWYALSDEEHAFLDGRVIGGVYRLKLARLPFTKDLLSPPRPTGRRVVRRNCKVGTRIRRRLWLASTR